MNRAFLGNLISLVLPRCVILCVETIVNLDLEADDLFVSLESLELEDGMFGRIMENRVVGFVWNAVAMASASNLATDSMGPEVVLLFSKALWWKMGNRSRRLRLARTTALEEVQR